MNVDPFEKQPVYEEDQVITYNDLLAIIKELKDPRIDMPEGLEYDRLQAAIMTVDMLATWLKDGKPIIPFWEAND
jgi:hypothetical protein